MLLQHDVEAAARAMLEGAAIDFRSLAPARAGREHHLLRVTLASGELQLLKVPRRDRMPDPRWPRRTPLLALRAEAQALGLLSGVAGPHPYTLIDGDPPGALMGIVPGTTPEVLYERGAMDEGLLTSVMVEMGRTLAAIHRAACPHDPGDIPVLPGCDPDHARLLHMDFHLGNVLGVAKLRRGFKLLGVVDWTRCAWGPAEEDFCELGTSVLASNPWALDPLLAGYNQHNPVRMRAAAVQIAIARELDRRLREDPPDSEATRNLWLGRVAEWG